jgi:Protein of unknown function (DUF2934)
MPYLKGSVPYLDLCLPANLKATEMKRPLEMEIVRRAYELWERAGKPDGKDQEFYHQAERELQEALNKEAPDKEMPDDI